MNKIYYEQVKLLLKVLPYVAQEEVFALKGGTAINMFVWDMPRLSVDLDLVYINFDDRDIAMQNISKALLNIKTNVLRRIENIKVETRINSSGHEEKLIFIHQNTQVKIEVNNIMRGIIHPTNLMKISKVVQEEFGLFADMKIISIGELFGGKICAALDRQHPRDLFDIHHMIKSGIYNNEVKEGFIAALLSHPRAIHKMLNPNFHDQQVVFASQFQGMSDAPFNYRDFELTRIELINIIHTSLNEQDKEFLISFKSGYPNWDLSSINRLGDLPAVKWKLLNIRKLIQDNKVKHLELLEKLGECLKQM